MDMLKLMLEKQGQENEPERRACNISIFGLLELKETHKTIRRT